MTLNRYVVETVDGTSWEVSAPNIVAAVVDVTKAEGRLISDVESVDFVEEVCEICGTERVSSEFRAALMEALDKIGGAE